MARKAEPKPPKFTPPEVVCTSLDEADRIFADWQELDAREARAKVDCGEATKAARDKFKEALYVVFPEGRVSFADRRQQFERAIQAYAEKHRDQVLLEKLKSRKLNFGELGWEKARDSIGVQEGRHEEGNQAILEDLQRHLRAALGDYKGIPPAVLDCLKIDVAWSREALLKAFEEGKFTRENLRAIGFKHVEGDDEFFAKPFKPTLTSVESAKEPA